MHGGRGRGRERFGTCVYTLRLGPAKAGAFAYDVCRAPLSALFIGPASSLNKLHACYPILDRRECRAELLRRQRERSGHERARELSIKVRKANAYPSGWPGRNRVACRDSRLSSSYPRAQRTPGPPTGLCHNSSGLSCSQARFPDSPKIWNRRPWSWPAAT